MKYKGYSIKENNSEAHPGFLITTPANVTWGEVAANVKTARRWIDAYLAEQRPPIKSVKPGRSFDCQPEDTEGAIFETHFDCWNDEDSDEGDHWEWLSDKAQDLFAKLMEQADKATGRNSGDFHFRALCSRELVERGQVETFVGVEKLFRQLGFDVYNSDTVFYAWRPGTVKASDDVDSAPVRLLQAAKLALITLKAKGGPTATERDDAIQILTQAIAKAEGK